MIETLAWLFMSETEDGLFGAPGFLWALALVPPLIALLVLMGRLHRARLRRLFAGDVLDAVRPRGIVIRRTLRDVLLVGGFVLGVVALSGPRCNKQIQLVEAKGVDLVLIVDLSRSMDANDVDPSRLERVRREMQDLVELLEGDRVGLVIFAGGAYPRMPLSDDHQALRMLVDELSTRDFQAQGSALDQAIDQAVKLLTADETSRAGRAAVLFSDGEIHDPASALEAAGRARDAGVRLFTVGVGESAAPIPLGQGLWQRDRQGRQVLSTPSPELLRELAKVGGGAFVGSEPTDRDMRRLYSREIRSLLQAGVRETRPKVRWTQAWPWPLGGAVMCLLIAGWLGEGRRRWGAAAAVLLAVGGLGYARPALAGNLGSADAAYRDGRYAEAARELTELIHDAPEDPELFRRLGAARYRAKDFEGAARAWARQAELEGVDDPDTLFDLANAYARSGRFERAIGTYEQVLAADPEHARAAANRDLITAELERRLAEQPPPEEQDGGESDPSDPGEDEPQQGEQGQEDEQGEGQPNDAGEPQEGEGQEGEDEEPAEGEQGEEAEDGEQSEDSQGSADGQHEQSERDETGENETAKDSQGQKPTTEGQERADSSDVDGVNTEDLDVEGGTSGQGEAVPEPLTPEQAAARRAEEMLEGVKEGRPRVTIPGGSGDKPW